MHCGSNLILNDEMPSDDRRYFIKRVIKSGGQGSVYEGIDQDGTIYAIKELLDRFHDPEERADAVTRLVRLNRYSQVTFETNRYSVPVDQACVTLTLQARPFQITILDQQQVIATHDHCLARSADPRPLPVPG
jgi:hypothetical protein